MEQDKLSFRFLPFVLLIVNSFMFSINCFAVSHSQFQCDTSDKRLIVRYFSNGKIKEKGYQGYYSNDIVSTGTFLGTWKTYYQNGGIIKTIYYHNDIPSKAYI